MERGAQPLHFLIQFVDALFAFCDGQIFRRFVLKCNTGFYGFRNLRFASRIVTR